MAESIKTVPITATFEEVMQDKEKLGVCILRGDLQETFTRKLDLAVQKRKLRINGQGSDRVCMREQDFEVLRQRYEDMPVEAEAILNRSIFDDFQLCIDTEIESQGVKKPYTFTVWYSRPSVEPFKVKTADGKILSIVPITEVVADEEIYTLGFIEDMHGKYHIFISAPIIVDKGGNLGYLQQFVFNEPTCVVQRIGRAWAFAIIYKIFVNKPEIVTIRTEERAVKPANGKRVQHSKKKRNKVKIVKRIAIEINEGVVSQAPTSGGTGGKHTMTCPAWGVVGHYRTYKKTGKRVWIAPYKKGKQRNNPQAYQTKDYGV